MLKRIIIFFGKICFSFSSKKTNKIKKIALFKSGAMGDILMTTPLVRALRKSFPKAKITYITGEKFYDVLKGNKNIDKILVFDEQKIFSKFPSIRYFLNLSKKIRKEKFDICFILDKSYLANLFIYFCRVPFRIGFDRNGEGFANTISIPYKKVKHEIKYYLELLRPLGIKDDELQTEIFLTKKDEKFANDFLKKNKIKKPIIGVAVAQTSDPQIEKSSRCWSKEYYKRLIENMSKKYSIILFGSESDSKVADYLKSDLNNVYNSVGKTSIKQAAALMKKCSVFVTHDCGLMHLAAAVKTPVVAIFGPTDPRRKAPIGHKYLWKDTIRCEECEIYGKFPYCEKHAKTNAIKPKKVIKHVENIIKK